MNTLIIVDPQKDFITGTLPVDGAEVAMKKLAETLECIPVNQVVVTMDCHTLDHISFESQGGPWPLHCIKYSVGATIFEPLFQALYKWNLKEGRDVIFIEKGTAKDRDEYSAFHTTYPEVLDASEEIFVCGIAGDVCVLNSIKDLAKFGLAEKMTVIKDASPSLDDGTALRGLIERLDLKTTELNKF